MPIIIWNEYTCKLSGETLKFVECAECKQKYIYTIVRQAQGQGNSLYFLDNAGAERRATIAAQAELQKALNTDCDPVPCPRCGSYQDDMIAKLRREYRLWMFWAGIFTIFASALCGALGYALVGTESHGGVGLCLLAILGIGSGIGMMVWRRKMANVFEPNEAPLDTRLAIGGQRAVMVKNFQKWLQEQGIEFDQPSIRRR